MAGFNRVSGSDRGFRRYTTSSLAINAGDLLEFSRSAGTVTKATSSTSLENLAGVAVESIASTDTSVLVQLLSKDDLFIAPLTNNSSASHNYQRMVLTDENEVNNTGTDSTSDAAVVTQVGVVGAAADKKALVMFNLNVDRA
jgi:hypothetical protein